MFINTRFFPIILFFQSNLSVILQKMHQKFDNSDSYYNNHWLSMLRSGAELYPLRIMETPNSKWGNAVFTSHSPVRRVARSEAWKHSIRIVLSLKLFLSKDRNYINISDSILLFIYHIVVHKHLQLKWISIDIILIKY